MDLTRRLTSQAPFSQPKKHAEANRIVVTSAGLLMALFTCHLVALACTCDLPMGRSVKQQVIESRQKSTAVFSGTVLEVISQPQSTFVLVRFKAETFWKGNNSSQVTVSTGRGSGDCGFHFEVGKQYLVYAYGPENVLQTNICQRTTSLSEAAEDLRILGEGGRPQQSRESRPETKVIKTSMSVRKTEASFARSTATVEAVVTAYEEVSASTKFVGSVRIQVLLLRVRRVLRGHEDSRYIIVHKLYGGTDQPLSGQDLARQKLRRFLLTRDPDCDGPLDDSLYVKQVTTTGETIGRTPRLRLLDKQASSLSGDMILPCYNMFPTQRTSSPESVYIEFERSATRTPLYASDSDKGIWLRLHNNTKWPIVLNMHGVPSSDYGDASLIYDVLFGNEVIIPDSCHACSFNSLGSGQSLLFSVPAEHLSTGRVLRIKFSYSREDSNKVTGGLEPEQYVYFYASSLAPPKNVRKTTMRVHDSSVSSSRRRPEGLESSLASDPLANIPAPDRARLIERLNLLIEYQRDERWSKQFDLLTDLYLQGDDKNTYVRNKKHYRATGDDDRFIEFVPRSASGPNKLINGGQWQIFGCGRWLDGNRKVKYDTSVIAVREKGDWYFSEVRIVLSVGGPPEPCPNADGSSGREISQQGLREAVQSAIDLPFPSEANESRRRLSRIGGPGTAFIAEAIRVNQHMNPIKKAFLVDVINGITGDESISALRTLLSDNDAHVRGLTATFLGKRRAAVTIPDLISLLSDHAVYFTTISTDPPSEKYVLVRDAAIEALQDITGLVQAPHSSKEKQAQEWIRWWRDQSKATATTRERQN